MSWLQNVLSGESKIRSELIELAERGRDETLSPSDRLQAMFELGAVVQAGENIQEAVNQFLVGQRVGVGHERVDLLWSRRKSQ